MLPRTLYDAARGSGTWAAGPAARGRVGRTGGAPGDIRLTYLMFRGVPLPPARMDPHGPSAHLSPKNYVWSGNG